MICVLQLLPVSSLGIPGGIYESLNDCDEFRGLKYSGGFDNLSLSSSLLSIARQDTRHDVSSEPVSPAGNKYFDHTQAVNRRRSYHINQEWERIRPILTRLYRDQKYKLKEIINIMATVHDFHAPVHMFKKKISDWGLTRSFTSAEKAKFAAIARKCIASKEILPFHDDQGRRIPWERVRRQVGRRAIPTKVMPLHGSRARHTVGHRQSIRYPEQLTNGMKYGKTMTKNYQACHDSADQMVLQLPGLALSTCESRRLESMLYHAQEFYRWHICVHTDTILHAQDHREIRNAYAYAFDKFNMGLTRAATQCFMTAGQHVITAMQLHTSADFLCSLLCIIHRSFSCGTPSVAKVVLRFLVASSQEILGLSNPLTILLSSLREMADDGVSRSSIPFRILSGCIIDSIRTLLNQTDTKELRYAAYFAQEEFVQVLKDDELYLDAEQQCQKLISFTTTSFGFQSSMTMRARCLMGWVLLCQSRLQRAQALLEDIWQQWSHGLLQDHEDHSQEMCGVFPAFYLSVLYREQGDVRSALYYRAQAFECSIQSYGPTHTWTLAHFRWLLHDLEVAGELTRVEKLKVEFPGCYDQMCLHMENDTVEWC